MISLIRNEITKLYKRPFFWISVLLIMACVLGYAAILSFAEEKWPDIDSYWEETARTDNLSFRAMLLDESIAEEEREFATSSLRFNEYCLERHIPPSDWRRGPAGYFLDYEDGKLLDRIVEPEEVALIRDRCEAYREMVARDDWRKFLALRTEEEYKPQMERFIPNSYGYQEALCYLEGHDLRFEYDIRLDRKDWRSELVDTYVENKIRLMELEYLFPNEFTLSEQEARNVIDENIINLHRIKNNIPPYGPHSLPVFLQDSTILYYLVMVIMVIMTGICVTNEFALGTIVQLLSYPFKRYKILLAKIATLLLSGYLLLMVLYAVALIYGHAFLGGNLAMLPQLVLVSGEVQEVNFYLFVFLKYNLCFIEMSVYICLTVLLSILSRSAAITIGLGIPAALVFKELVRFLARQFDIANLKFVPFVSYDFNQFLDNNVVVADITILFAVVVTMLSLVFINLGSFAVLQRKDV